ncbi:putative pentatricopeptide [Rosa chinensis]|uniref:Putative pentatricopeptide n=1 Tax=Rosa chinensis TaxID=74649 RepID=A0A2P6Q7D4_ROSCH|nr:putative pentatricopeptide [Rosa chinensis]
MVHTHLLKTGFFSDVYAATILMDASMKLNLMDNALKVFDEMPHRNLAPVNTVISGLLHNGHRREALKVCKSVGFGGLRLNLVTIASVFSACDNVKQGMGMDCVAMKLGVESDNGVPSVVLDVLKKMRACRGENPNSVTLVSVHGLIMKDDGIGVGVRMRWRRACVGSIWLLGLGDLRER